MGKVNVCLSHNLGNSIFLGSCTLPGQLSMDNHICLIGGQIFYFIVHVFFQLSTCIYNCPVVNTSLRYQTKNDVFKFVHQSDIYDCPWTIVREGQRLFTLNLNTSVTMTVKECVSLENQYINFNSTEAEIMKAIKFKKEANQSSKEI
ncbi:hypothetical protein BpHYR1_050984 [Brachionus plicatilis]|uniref:Uncharacterized protein n=1 Tax=Brachionus plicatilis TaxID=10195 RepID=A0A3M7QXD4_BRAPC|nr:hypothetical protein BpHYR1_050984 [Brachionus plicatilis]